MDLGRFEMILKARLVKTRKTLDLKANEYSSAYDRLANFKEAASFTKTTPERALLGFTAKHLVALVEFINGLETNNTFTQHQWEEKIGDTINYLILLEALLSERYKWDKENY